MFENQDPGVQGANGYIWALLALDSKDYEEPEDAVWNREKLVDAILEKSRKMEDFHFPQMEIPMWISQQWHSQHWLRIKMRKK